MRSLYIHFPFCESKCHYCDFYSIGRERTSDSDPLRFEIALERECALNAPKLSDKIDTIFFGGGTPSMTPPESMKRALAPLDLKNRVHSKTEWTMEANPSSVDLENLVAYRELGVNRISMGVQSLRDDHLLKLGRVHSKDAAFLALETIFKAGFTNVSVDLLCGVPGQTEDDLNSAMDQLLQFPITHLSCYLLTLPKTHRMFKELPKEEEQLAHLLRIDEKMKSAGLEHYEISNFCRPGKEAQHNLTYWKLGSYLGLGPSAHSYDAVAKKRWKNISSLHAYAKNLEEGKSVVEWEETLTTDQEGIERWMLGLRLSEGIPTEWISSADQKQKAERFKQEGYLEEHPSLPNRVRLTARGFAISDSITAGFI
jgi:oxygen-independent coproporphyrinogen III oxidase